MTGVQTCALPIFPVYLLSPSPDLALKFGDKLMVVGEKEGIQGVARLLGNMCSGLFAAIAGILWISRTGSAQPSTGADWMVISFAVAVIGGTALKGGVFNPIGLFFAGFLIVMVKNGLVMLNANVYFEQTYLGLILLLAVSLESIKNIWNRKKLKDGLKKEAKLTGNKN